MSVYNDIIAWSGNKADFIKDALRRLITSPSLSATDIDELTELLKKEVGFTGITRMPIPITNSHIPVTVTSNTDVAKILSIENPVNINSLFNRAKLEFQNTGLTVVYGNNGSGKSSYSKILKKVCWSRHKNVQLKTNVYTNDQTPQSVTVNYEKAASKLSFNWNIASLQNTDLSSIYVFDSDCANIYLNSENVTEYKPVGIDLLERLIQTFGAIENKINIEKRTLVTVKPTLDYSRFGTTAIYNWYQTIERVTTQNIQNKLVFIQTNLDRKNELIALLRNTNPAEQKQSIQQKIIRYQSVLDAFNTNSKLFTQAAFEALIKIKEDYISKYDAFTIAQSNIHGNYTLNGVGSDTWRIMWEAAKAFALTEVHPQTQNFLDETSKEYCVFCQQELGDEAVERLNKFNLFINDTTSKAYNDAKKKLEDTILVVRKNTIEDSSTYIELESDIVDFKQLLDKFIGEFNNGKATILRYLDATYRNNIEKISPLSDIITPINSVIGRLQKAIVDIDNAVNNRVILEAELIELEALEILTNSSAQILQYHIEYITKYYLDKCLSQLNSAMISRKIGEILESSAITLQHQEFITHLTSLNPTIAAKVSISKTRTASGTTFQKVGFSNINESLSSILSEGEQKIVALANFLSECTIDNKVNSIIFDDPVTSLDQDYRESIVNKLISLSANRQVIVLTHDLYFLRMLLEKHNQVYGNDCKILGLDNKRGNAGWISDEIPYLAKNAQQRIDSIKPILIQINSLTSANQSLIDSLLDSARKKFRMLIEKAVEELLANKSIERFSKNIHVKSGNLSGFVVVEHADIQFLLSLFAKYSITEHDGGVSTVPQLPDESVIDTDLSAFSNWMNDFKTRLRDFKTANGY